jgi:hypothetical protein
MNKQNHFAGEYGITREEELKNQEDMKIFLEYIHEKKADLNVLSRTYRFVYFLFFISMIIKVN